LETEEESFEICCDMGKEKKIKNNFVLWEMKKKKRLESIEKRLERKGNLGREELKSLSSLILQFIITNLLDFSYPKQPGPCTCICPFHYNSSSGTLPDPFVLGRREI
jgi:hypothetical protein